MQDMKRLNILWSLLFASVIAVLLTSWGGCSKSVYKDSYLRQSSGRTGPTWSPVRINVIEPKHEGHVQILALAVDPTTPDTLYASTRVTKFEGFEHGLLKTTDGGVSWTRTKYGVPLPLKILCIAIDPQNTSTIYVGTAGGGVYKSITAGAKWAPMSTGMKLMPAYRRDTYYQDINALAIDPQDTTTIYAATRGGGIYKSTNAAESWDQVNSGLTDVEDPLGILGKIGAHAIAIDPTNPQIIYSSTTERGVFKSTNGGQRWANTHLTLRKDKLSTGMFGSSNSITATTLAIDPKNPTTIYAGLAGTGVYKSSNAGETWEPVNSGLGSAGIVVRTLTIDPQNPGTIYGGTQRGVIRTLNGGQNWEFINSGLHLVDNLDQPYLLAQDSLRPHTMYVGSTLLGIYRSSNITAVE